MKKFLFICFFIMIMVSTNKNLPINYDLIDSSIDDIILYNKIKNSGILYVDVVFAQAKLESGNFTSNVFVCDNNLFGMKQPKLRNTLSLGESEHGYASYMNWKMSVEDYRLWQTTLLRNKKINTQDEYLNYIGRIYAEDGSYVRKIKSMIRQHAKKKLNIIKHEV